jgi:hypothetical protein
MLHRVGLPKLPVGARQDRLSFLTMEPERGIEPRSLVYHTSALPLSYTDIGAPGGT